MKILIFGYGYMGKIRYAVLKNHPQVEQIRVIDPSLATAPRELGADLWPADSEVPWDNCDAIFVCTPNNVTAKLAAEGLRRGKHVFCEKPPGRDWEDFQQIEEAAKTYSGILMFGFNHRLHPSVAAAKSLLGEGGMGRVLYLKGAYGKSGGQHYRKSWRNNNEISGGGILLDQGIHLLDIFSNFLGPLEVVNAVLVDSFWGCGVEDNAFVLMKSADNVPVFLHSSATLWKHTFRFEVGCENGYLIASGFLSKTGSYGREQLVIGKRQFEDEVMALGNPREEIVYFDRDESWDKEVNEFVAAAIEGRPAAHGSLLEARQVMKIIKDVYAKAGLQTTMNVSQQGTL